MKNKLKTLAMQAVCGLAALALICGVIEISRANIISSGVVGSNDRGNVVNLGVTNIVLGWSTNSGANIAFWGTASATPAAGSLGGLVDISAFDNVGITVNATNATATNAVITFGLKRSIDALNFESQAVAPLNFSVTLTAATNTTWYTNLNYDSIGGVIALEVSGLTNTTQAPITNLQILVSTKVKQNSR